MTRKVETVAVLMGGFSAEREVSLVSGKACAEALEQAGYTVMRIDPGRDVAAWTSQLDPRPDAVFNALHGRWGEDGCIQGVLEVMGIPYTHSGVMASALAMDKPAAKKVFEAVGIPTAPHRIVAADSLALEDPLPRPFVIKPLNEGSSVDVHVVRENEPLPSLNTAGPVMVEAFVGDRELTVTVMGTRALAVTEITTSRGFYDFDAKYAPGGSVHVVPAELPETVTARCLELAKRAHEALGCRGITRADFRWNEHDGEAGLYILEVNTQPGMTPTSLVPEQAAFAGYDFPALVSWMVEHARCDS